MSIKRWASPVSALYSYAMITREKCYANRWFKSVKVKKPVISIGNLTMGGTGKTAIISFLVQKIQGSNHKLGIISRGYKGRYKGVEEVTLGSKSSVLIFGDEPCMLKEQYPDTPIFVAAKRSEAAKALIKKYNVNVILADDGFQHISLKRDLDIIIFDLTEDLENYEVLPQGRMRESWEALKRAHIVIYNKCNLVSNKTRSANLEYLEQKMNKYNSEITRLWTNYKIMGITSLFNKFQYIETLGEDENILLISGLGKPESFESSVKAYYKNVKSKKNVIWKHLTFRDHHSYSISDVKRIINIYDQLEGRSRIICSEKDAVKLKAFKDLEGKLFVTSLGVEWAACNLITEDEFYDKNIRRLL